MVAELSDERGAEKGTGEYGIAMVGEGFFAFTPASKIFRLSYPYLLITTIFDDFAFLNRFLI